MTIMKRSDYYISGSLRTVKLELNNNYSESESEADDGPNIRGEERLQGKAFHCCIINSRRKKLG